MNGLEAIWPSKPVLQRPGTGAAHAGQVPSGVIR